MLFGDERLPARFWAKIEVVGDCWLWRRAMAYPLRYGYYNAVGVHRTTYLAFVGKIPENYDVDHLCRVRACCNPAHLEAVTRSTNLRRGNSGKHSALRLGELHPFGRRTHCKYGHEYTVENTLISLSPQGRRRRHCRICAKNRMAKWKKEKQNGRPRTRGDFREDAPDCSGAGADWQGGDQ